MTTINDGNAANVGPTGAAISFVNQGWDFFEDKALMFSGRALNLIDRLSYVPTVQPTYFNVHFPELDGLTAFQRPARPVLPDMTFREIDVPLPPDISGELVEPGMDAAPVFDVDRPAPVALPVQPGRLQAQRPGAAPELEVVAMPASMVLPPLPAFLDLTIEPMPALPAFAGRDPGEAPRLPDLSAAGFTEQAYTPAMLDALTPKIRQGLASGTILDRAIEDALFHRSRERTLLVVSAEQQAVDEEFSGRGFKMPPGAWAARRKQARRQRQDAVLDTNRDLTIQFHTEAIKNVQFAVVQGIALEQLLIGQHGAIQDRALKAAESLLDTHVALFNAEVAGYNAALERLKTDAAVHRDQIQAAVEAYRGYIAGKGAQADSNRADADVYRAQIEAAVEAYRGELERVRAQSERDRNRIEGHRSTVQAFAEEVRAHQSEWDGYTAAVNAQQAGFRNYEIGVNAYAQRVNAWGEAERAKSSRYDTRMRAASTKYEGYRAHLQGVLGRIQAEGERIGALTSRSNALAQMYQADGQIESAANDANTRAFQAATTYAEARANIQLREAEIKMQDASRLLTAQVEALRGAAQAMSQLAASAMSAVNFSANVSGSGSENSSFSYAMSKSKNWSWSGETPDSNSPDIF